MASSTKLNETLDHKSEIIFIKPVYNKMKRGAAIAAPLADLVCPFKGVPLQFLLYQRFNPVPQ